MPLQLVCKCGKHLSIPDDHAGRRIMCPGCGASLQAPGGETASVSGAKGRSRGSAGRVVVLLLGVLLLAGGAGAAWWFLFREAAPVKEGDDLALIPANAQGFVSIRLADLWKSPAMQKAREKAGVRETLPPDPAEEMDRETGLRPEEVERLTLVGVDAGRRIVRTLQPYNRRKVLSRLKDGREFVYQGERYSLGAGPDGAPRAIWFAGTRVLVMGTEEGVKRCLDFAAGSPATGPLAPVIELAAGGHTAVAGIYPAGGPLEKWKAVPFLKSIADMHLLTATLDVSEKATLNATAKMDSEEKAKGMVKTIKDNRKTIQWGLLIAQFDPGVKGKAAALLSTLLGKAKFAHKGDEATATVTIEDGSSLAELLLALPGAMKQ